MDRRGRVNGPFKRLKVARQAEAIRKEPPPLPGNGLYRVAVADPPWPFDLHTGGKSRLTRSVRPYPMMTIAQICALDVASIMYGDSIFWLWTDNFHLLNGGALRVLGAWGFKPVTMVTWAKDRMGLGHWLRCQTEHCILATRGKPTVVLTDETTLLNAPAGRHSEKPDAFYALVEKLCPAPRYAELFSRRRRKGWDGHRRRASGGGGGVSGDLGALALRLGGEAAPEPAP